MFETLQFSTFGQLVQCDTYVLHQIFRVYTKESPLENVMRLVFCCLCLSAAVLASMLTLLSKLS